MKAVRPEETLRKLCVFALGVVLLNALLAGGWLWLAAMKGDWQLVLLHSGKCFLITGWVAYRWTSLVRRRYLITRPWQAGRPQLLKTLFQRVALLASSVWLLIVVWQVYTDGFSYVALMQLQLLWLPSLSLACFIAIDIVNFLVIEKVVLDAGEGDVSRYTY